MASPSRIDDDLSKDEDASSETIGVILSLRRVFRTVGIQLRRAKRNFRLLGALQMFKRDSTPPSVAGLQPKISAMRLPSCRFFEYKELVYATSNFLPENLIGKGRSGEVYKGCLPDGKEVAVKILIKPSEDAWKEFILNHVVPDEAVSKCTACGVDFGAFVRRHHCRNCGDIFCDKCTRGRSALTSDENAQPVRVCDRCMDVVTLRLRNAKGSSSKPVLQSHEDLAKKLQDELERNRRISGSKSDRSGRRMKEVACPICTVHLQVQVPSSGSETIECGVCQHPFIVSSR